MRKTSVIRLFARKNPPFFSKPKSKAFMLLIPAITLLNSCKKQNSANILSAASPSPVRKIIKVDNDSSIYTLTYNADSNIAVMDVRINSAHAYTMSYTYSSLYNLTIKDYGNGSSEKDSLIFNNGKPSDTWHTDQYGNLYATHYTYNTDGLLSKAISSSAFRNDTISYQWHSGNIISTSGFPGTYNFTYDTTKTYQPGDCFYLNTVTNSSDVTFKTVNKNLTTAITATSVNMQYSYLWDGQGRITQCKEHNVLTNGDTFWYIEY